MDWQDIETLVGRAAAGDADAFRHLLRAHSQIVTSTLLACGVRSPESARDLAQDVALKAWTHLRTLRDPRTFNAWIRRIAANAARDHLRRLAARREQSLEQAVDLVSESDPQSDVVRTAEMRFMLAALRDEDPETVDLLVARAEGLSIAEIAQRLDLTPAALKMRLMRARKRLQQRLEEMRSSGPA